MATNNRRVAAYLPPEIDQAFTAFKIQRGLATSDEPNQNDSQGLIQILSEFLEVNQKVTHFPASDLLERIRILEEAITQLSKSVDRRFEDLQTATVLSQPASIEEQYELLSDSPDSNSDLPGEPYSNSDNFLGNVPPDQADGLRWLTTSQAFDRAKERGFTNNKNSFKGWSQRNPEDCLKQFGLRRINHSYRNNRAPGYEDVRWQN